MSQEDRQIEQARSLLQYAQHVYYIRPYRAGAKFPKYPRIAGRTISKKVSELIIIFTPSSNLAEALSTTIKDVPNALNNIQQLVGKDIFSWQFAGKSEKVGPLKNHQLQLMIQNKKMEGYFDDQLKNRFDIPKCFIKEGVGFLKITGKKIKIGKEGTRKFKLLNCLCNPFGVAKTLETIFDAARLPKDGMDSALLGAYRSTIRKQQIVENTFGEIQEIMRKAKMPDTLRLKKSGKDSFQLIQT